MHKSNYSYRLFKGANWGIAIDFNINIKPLKYLINGSNKSIFLEYSEKVSLNEDEKKHLNNGLKWVANLINNDKSIIIEIENIVFNETDFQKEGLYFGIAHWAGNYFGFTIPEYESFFNKDINAYEFLIKNDIDSDYPNNRDL